MEFQLPRLDRLLTDARQFLPVNSPGLYLHEPGPGPRVQHPTGGFKRPPPE